MNVNEEPTFNRESLLPSAAEESLDRSTGQHHTLAGQDVGSDMPCSPHHVPPVSA